MLEIPSTWCYVLLKGITTMEFKAASRARGLNDSMFRKAFGNRRAVSEHAGPAARRRGLRLSGLWSSRALLSDMPADLSIQPLQEVDLAYRRYNLLFGQATADGMIRGHPLGRNGEGRHLVGGAGMPVGGQTGDDLDDEAEDHGGDGAARRGGQAAVGVSGGG